MKLSSQNPIRAGIMSNITSWRAASIACCNILLLIIVTFNVALAQGDNRKEAAERLFATINQIEQKYNAEYPILTKEIFFLRTSYDAVVERIRANPDEAVKKYADSLTSYGWGLIKVAMSGNPTEVEAEIFVSTIKLAATDIEILAKYLAKDAGFTELRDQILKRHNDVVSKFNSLVQLKLARDKAFAEAKTLGLMKDLASKPTEKSETPAPTSATFGKWRLATAGASPTLQLQGVRHPFVTSVEYRCDGGNKIGLFVATRGQRQVISFGAADDVFVDMKVGAGGRVDDAGAASFARENESWDARASKKKSATTVLVTGPQGQSSNQMNPDADALDLSGFTAGRKALRDACAKNGSPPSASASPASAASPQAIVGRPLSETLSPMDKMHFRTQLCGQLAVASLLQPDKAAKIDRICECAKVHFLRFTKAKFAHMAIVTLLQDKDGYQRLASSLSRDETAQYEREGNAITPGLMQCVGPM